MRASCDVVILGAGAAGVAAARDLSRRGLRVVVLEARARCGGRMHTVRDAATPLPVELGAEFVHGTVPEVFALAAKAGARVVELPDRHAQARAGGLRPMQSFWSQLDPALASLARGRDASLAERLAEGRVRGTQRERLLGFVEGYHGADPDRVSARWLAAGAEAEDHRQFRVVDGYDRILAPLLRELAPGALRLRTVARAVEWRRGAVTVRAERAPETAPLTVRARALVCTLPVGVLQAPPGSEGGVRFTPALRDKERALSRLAAGAVSKTTLCFRDRFWTRGDGGVPAWPDLHFAHAFGRPVPTVWSELPVLTPTLVAWAGASAAARLLEASADERLAVILAEIARVLGREPNDVHDALQSHHHHDWVADPYSRGAYAYVTVGGQRAPARLAQPIDDTLFFAGEATDAEQMGTVAGGLASGHRAAGELLTAIAPR